ncbi:MAG: flagellar hook-associated protein FlgK [Clostridiales bacterium]|nr:flagellar hook-associated protein FlgK [Clostridiales bacterium]
MAVGFSSYEIARSGLTFNERGLDVTGHNIANVNTLGYSRQQAVAADSFYIKNNAKYGYGQVGVGVDIQQTRQIRHKFLDNIYRYENAKADYWSVRSDTFSEVESILGEPVNEGLQSLLNRYWDAWQELSKDPSSLTTRSLVRQLGESIAFEMNNVGAQFDQMQLELDAQFVDSIKSLDALCSKVADLNRLIKSVQIAGEAPNDYMDERNALLDQISSLVDCEIYERDDGMYDVISGGTYLVYRDSAKRLVTTLTPESGMFHKAFVVMREGTPPLLEEMRFGQCKIKGILESRGESVSMLDVSAATAPFDLTDPLNTTKTVDVMFARSSISNGSPNTQADIVIAIDLSDSSAEYLDKIKTDIDSYVDGLYKKGLDFNLKLVTYSATAAVAGEYPMEKVNDFIADVLSLTTNAADNLNNFGGAGGLLEAIEGLANDPAGSHFRPDANRYTVLFTAESIDGDETAVTSLGAQQYADRLSAVAMSFSAVTQNAKQYDGDGTATAPFGWNTITGAAGGVSIDYDEVVGSAWQFRGFDQVMADANDFVNGSVNDRISMVPSSMQILPEARRRVNALINIICRSVNELHRNGKTLEAPPKDGEDFFVPINPKYPLELGNIRINPKFLEPSGLNYIVASESGATEDNNIARAIANLRNLSQSIRTVEGRTTFDDYYRDAIYSISNSAAETERFLTNQITVTGSLDQMRHAIMDVAMDEELANMMKFKFGYDAAARVLNVIDNMIETIVTRLGLVGR